MLRHLFGWTSLALLLAIPSSAAHADPLRDGFADPPASARPWVWWHWMNGNISAEGARLDLEWMRRVGIGGVQVFEGNLATPVLVDHRLVWMSPDWKAALSESVRTADRLGLGFAIATSPGWSISGAPFVSAADAMKKLAWSETRVSGRGVIRLPAPPAVAGPYQDISGDASHRIVPFYRDVAVVAFRDESEPTPIPRRASADGSPVDYRTLADGAYGAAISLPYAAGRAEAAVLYDYGRPVTVRSVTLGLPGARGFGAPPAPAAILEGSNDGHTFRRIAELPGAATQVRSAAFAPASLRFARLRLVGGEASTPPVATGVVKPVFGPPPPCAFALSEFILRSEGRVHRAEEKAGFAAADDYAALATPPDSVARAIDPAHVLDLSDRLRPDGTLAWAPPAGRWTVLRFGYTLTGHENGPAPAEAIGLEVDKLDADAVRRYADAYLGRYANAVGPGAMGRRGITALLSDSIESGPQNWTAAMPARFRADRGYDLVRWLPALAGRVVGSAGESDRFLWDFRRTIADLVSTAHYDTLAAAARSRGLSYYAEALEDHRPQLGDDLRIRTAADVPMAAMWAIPPGGAPRQTFVADIQGAASVAHAAGKPIVAAESFTAFGAPWAFAPRDLKATADLEFALGVNRIVIHTSPHQPFTDGRAPGMALAPFLGQYFSRTETWADMARPWTDYLARASFLLQQGRHAADIAWFVGEDAPVTGLYGETPAPVPAGYGFDFVGPDTLAGLSVGVDERLHTPGGAGYTLLVLSGSSRWMTLATLERVRDLVAAGATVVGTRPLGSPSLADDAAAFDRIADALWSGDGPTRIHATLDTALRARALTRDWQAEGFADADVALIHRHLPDGELWFVANRAGRAIAGSLSLRGNGRVPELWHADTGRIDRVSYSIADGRTTVPLALGANGSVFILLRRPATTTAETLAAPAAEVIGRFAAPWNLRFPDAPGAPAPTTLTTLRSWTEASDPVLRFHSGTAIYRSTIAVARGALRPGRRLLLDLGDVREIAEVRVNGESAGTAWTPPFRVDVTRQIRPGRNVIEVRVANLWVNRLIGDAQPGAVGRTVTTGPTYAADSPLRPSGLLGPVTLVAETEPVPR